VLKAFAEVENALTDIERQTAASQVLAVASARESLNLTQLQFDQGLVTYLQVILAEQTLLTNELNAATSLNQRFLATTQLIRALGGGWSVATPDACS
jgi:outer membrane protein, multidrug efflux system